MFSCEHPPPGQIVRVDSVKAKFEPDTPDDGRNVPKHVVFFNRTQILCIKRVA
jgi:hypothetical protein